MTEQKITEKLSSLKKLWTRCTSPTERKRINFEIKIYEKVLGIESGVLKPSKTFKKKCLECKKKFNSRNVRRIFCSEKCRLKKYYKHD